MRCLCGYKFHMNDVSATVGIENLKHAERLISKHKENAAYYDKHLQNTTGITLLKREKGFDSSFWIYSMLVDDRDGFYKHMEKCNIVVSQVHERNDKHSTVREFRAPLPTLDKTSNQII